MIDSSSDRSRPRLAAVAAACLIGCLSPALALAESDRPVRIVPEWDQAPVKPVTLPAPPKPDDTTPRQVRVGIEAQSLTVMEPDGAGTLDELHGGFAATYWTGTTRTMARAVLTALPTQVSSPAVWMLTRRLLANAAPPPRPLAGESAEPLLPLRIEKLAALGATQDVVAMSGMVQPGKEDERIARARLESRLVAGEPLGKACPEVTAASRSYGGLYWQRALVLCQLATGGREQAFLGLDLLREQGRAEPVLRAVAEELAGLRAKQTKGLPEAGDLIDVAALREAKKPIVKDVAKIGSPTMLRLVALSGQGDLDGRLAAAERAAAAGIVDPAIVRELYLGYDFSSGEKARTLADLTAKTPRERALLYQIAVEAADPGVRAEVAGRALELAAADGKLQFTGAIYERLIEELPPDSAMAAQAPRLVRALLGQGRYEPAGRWMTLAREVASASPAGAQAVQALWPLERVAHALPGRAYPADAIDAWRAAQTLPPEVLRHRAGLLANILDALGEPVSPNDWAGLLDGAQHQTRLPGVAAWNALTAAAAGKRVAETLALALIVIGGQEPGQVAPVVLHQVIAALRMAGLEAEARALAVEAMMAHGL